MRRRPHTEIVRLSLLKTQRRSGLWSGLRSNRQRGTNELTTPKVAVQLTTKGNIIDPVSDSAMFLTLDPLTLFYHNLRNEMRGSGTNKTDSLNSWASHIPPHAKPDQPRLASGVSSLTMSDASGPASTVPSSRSAFQANIKVKSATSGNISDPEEINGDERALTANSPVKGKHRVTSDVSICFFINVLQSQLIIIILVEYRRRQGRKSRAKRTEICFILPF